MFNDVHFSGNINLGTVVLAMVNLFGAIGIYFRVKAWKIEQEAKLNHIERTVAPNDPPAIPQPIVPPDPDPPIV